MLAGVSDLLAQRLSGSSASGIHWRRTLAIALYGIVWSGPAGHYWQQVLERLFPDKKDPLRRFVGCTAVTAALLRLFLTCYKSPMHCGAL